MESMERLEAANNDLQEEINRIDLDIEKEKIDKTGLPKEEFYHHSLYETVLRNVVFDEEGRAEIKKREDGETQEEIFFIRFSNVNLARVNKESGHLKGDISLRLTANNILSTIESNGVDKKDLFHLRGSDFSGILQTTESNIESIEKIVQDLEIQYQDNHEGVRVSFSKVSLSDLVDSYNLYNPQNKNTNHIKSFCGYVSSVSDYLSEYSKTKKVLSDFKQKIDTETSDADLSKEKEYYEKYIDYIFRGQGKTMSFEKFRKVRPERIELISESIAYKRVFEEDIPVIEARTNTSIVNRIGKLIQEGDLLERSVIETRLYVSELNTDPYKYSKEKTPSHERFIKEIEMFKIQEKKNMDMLLYLIKRMSERDGDLRMGFEDMEDIINMGVFFSSEREYKSRYGDRAAKAIIQMLTEYEYQRDLFENEPELRINFLKTREMVINLAKKAYMERSLRVDVTTGLKRENLFERDLEEKLKEFPEGNFCVMSIDMSFLKYFNQLNCREAGDLALQKTAYGLTEAVSNFQKVSDDNKFDIQIYRTGGDEFSLILDCNLDKASELLPVISAFIVKTGSIPRSELASSLYMEEYIKLGIGLSDMKSVMENMELVVNSDDNPYSEEETQIIKLINKGLIKTKDVPKDIKQIYKEVLIDIADKVSDLDKTRKIFSMLFNRYAAEDTFDKIYDKKTRTFKSTQLEQLTSYASKALYGNPNKVREIVQIAKQKGYDPQELNIEEFYELMDIFYKDTDIESTELQSRRPDIRRILEKI